MCLYSGDLRKKKVKVEERLSQKHWPCESTKHILYCFIALPFFFVSHKAAKYESKLFESDLTLTEAIRNTPMQFESFHMTILSYKGSIILTYIEELPILWDNEYLCLQNPSFENTSLRVFL